MDFGVPPEVSRRFGVILISTALKGHRATYGSHYNDPLSPHATSKYLWLLRTTREKKYSEV